MPPGRGRDSVTPSHTARRTMPTRSLALDRERRNRAGPPPVPGLHA
jgi:hypothetical protein